MTDPAAQPVSVIVIMRNSSSTIIPCLEGLASQDYPIAEIIVVDNKSVDNSVPLVEEYARRCPVPLRLVKQVTDGGLTTSYNTGARLAVSPLMIFAHSDGDFPSRQELRKLTAPLLQNSEVIAAYSELLMPEDLWLKYPFWEKFLFVRAVGRRVPTMCGKFDCIRKDAFWRAGGHNTERFTATCGYGGEDSDLYHRLTQQGAVVKSEAQVIHLHDISGKYSMRSLFVTRKLLACTYGKIVRFQGASFSFGILLLFVRPALAALPLIPHFHCGGLAVLILFSVLNSRPMYTHRSTLCNWRILSVPVLDVCLVYYEAFWFIQSLLTPGVEAKVKR